jgi:hypothetical protein
MKKFLFNAAGFYFFVTWPFADELSPEISGVKLSIPSP